MKTSSYRRIRASRVNGARSPGPRTPEGKARSSQNALRHGLLSKCVVLESESAQGFQSILSQHALRLAPADDVEQGYIDEMAAASWRLRRTWAIETALFDSAVQDQPSGDDLARLAAAFSKLAAGPELALLHRYETRLHMEYQRSLHNFLVLRQAGIPNEPNPIIEHQPALPDPSAEEISPPPDQDGPTEPNPS